MAKQRRTFLPGILCGLLVLAALFTVLQLTTRYDNKYTAGPPYGKDGVFAFTGQDLEKPLFLVDGWLLSVDGGAQSETFAGQYSNFAFPDREHSPFGSAVYHLSLQCPGTHALLLELPEIFTRYSLSINGTTEATNGSGSMVSFVLTDEAELTLTVENRSHYYSGLYYPPILGAPDKIAELAGKRTALYTAFAVSALTLALFSAVLWFSRARDGLFLHFGLLCLAFFVTCLHPFIWKLGLNSTLWYAIEDSARMFMLAQAVEVGAALAGWSDRKWFCKGTRIALYSVCIICFVTVCFIIPRAGGIINLYGGVVDLAYLLGWLLLSASAVGNLQKGSPGSAWLAGGCCAFGMGFLVNLVNNNRFEPIHGAWQTEYAGFCMVLLFGAVMICHNREMILQNRKLVSHMEELIEQRTSELQTVLLERKNFFSDMAHNLKAPIEAVHGFISMIREGNLYLDDELQEYIGYIESENDEIRRRVQSLSVLNTFDRITAPVTVIELDSLLEEVERKNRPETEAAGIYLTTHKLGVPAAVKGQKEKLLILFENLIYNALAFTSPDGKITIEPRLENDMAIITVSDTGCGIAPEKLPHIFERFYVGRENKNEGSGLGLYIAKLTVEEIGGKITVQSTPGAGTVFTICLPLEKER
ncbi:sensor histidine kinase [Hungatella effluvii]|uniref:sensor histidine kinase n=1 Tax=Hungatella effluvii TaxID=1096246 RepID=UPI0022E90795|nr:HAMP domain-containing sensor histidine kinase [Hungatella effluvii]